MKPLCCILMLLALQSSIGICGSAAEPEINATTKKAEDRVEFSRKDGATIASVRSPSGIGSATINRTTGDWPERMVLRLHLHGLEGLKVSNGKLEFVAEVAGPDKKRFLQVNKSSQPSNPPESKTLATYEIRSFDQGGRPADNIPLKDGYFEVRLPKELFADNPESITINWIDFYR